MRTPREKGKSNSTRFLRDRLNLTAELQRVEQRRAQKPPGVLTIPLEKKAKFRGERIRPHRDRHGDLYCIYCWWRTRIDAPKLPPRVPPGVTIPGTDVCICCPRPRTHRCRKTLSVSLVPGIWWDLKIANIPNCTHCVQGPHFEIIPGRIRGR